MEDTVSADMREYLTSEGYKELVLVGGSIIGTMEYFTTRGIVVNLTRVGYGRRYCYQDRAEASAALEQWVAAIRNGTSSPDNDHPPGNWIKVKGRFQGSWVDDLNPLWVDPEQTTKD